MKEIIQRSINNIQNIEERVLFKELMEEVFLGLYETNEKMYQSLEHRVLDETIYEEDRYTIRTGLVQRKYFDVSHHYLTPILESDIEEPVCHMRNLKENPEGGRISLLKVFLECEYGTIQELAGKNERFRGVVITDQKSYETECHLAQNKEYTEQVYGLYKIFIKNGIPWKTVNGPYINRMYDVCIDSIQEMKEEEAIQEIKIDFREYAPYIRYDCIPVWNVKTVLAESQGFPVPCIDHKNYEYTISLAGYGDNNSYLAADVDLPISHVRRDKEKLYITSADAKARKWKILILNGGRDKRIDQYNYPVFTNDRKDSFMERLYKKNCMPVKTKAELIRYIEGYGLQKYVAFKSYVICKRAEEIKMDTYTMNPFLLDEIRDAEAEKRLVLSFEVKAACGFLAVDMISFLVSEIQFLYPEYDCGGSLV